MKEKINFDGVKEKRGLIESYLLEIDWKLRHHGCDHWYFYNHKGKCTGMYLLFSETDGRICYEMDPRSGMPNFTFYLKDLEMEVLDNNCLSFSGRTDKSIFILCPNYDREREVRKAAPKKKQKKQVVGESTNQ